MYVHVRACVHIRGLQMTVSEPRIDAVIKTCTRTPLIIRQKSPRAPQGSACTWAPPSPWRESHLEGLSDAGEDTVTMTTRARSGHEWMMDG